MCNYWIIIGSGFCSDPQECPVDFVEGSDVADHVIVALTEAYSSITFSRVSPDDISSAELDGMRQKLHDALSKNYSKLHALVVSAAGDISTRYSHSLSLTETAYCGGYLGFSDWYRLTNHARNRKLVETRCKAQKNVSSGKEGKQAMASRFTPETFANTLLDTASNQPQSDDGQPDSGKPSGRDEMPKSGDRNTPTTKTPKCYLTSWREILDFLELKNNEEHRKKVRMLNEDFGGPIVLPGQGSQPRAEESTLIDWWNGLEKRFNELEQRRTDARATTASQHKYGKEGNVVPDIAGSVKTRRNDRKS